MRLSAPLIVGLIAGFALLFDPWNWTGAPAEPGPSGFPRWVFYFLAVQFVWIMLVTFIAKRKER